MKKNKFLIGIIGLFMFAGIAYSAPTVGNVFRTIIPEQTLMYDLGSTTRVWNNIYGNLFNLSGVGIDMLLSTDSSGNVVATSSPQVAFITATSTTATSTFAGKLHIGQPTYDVGDFRVNDLFKVNDNIHQNVVVANNEIPSIFGHGGLEILTDARDTSLATPTELQFGAYDNAVNTQYGWIQVKKQAFDPIVSSIVKPLLLNPIGGNIGIGTTSPYARLSVAGDIVGNQITGAYFTATSTSDLSYFPAGVDTSGTTGGYFIDNTLMFQASTTNDSIMVGEGAGESLLADGLYNVALGYDAGKSLTDGDENVCIGYESCENLTTGSGNVVMGREAFTQATSTDNSVAIGSLALQNVVDDGTANIAIGYSALKNNTYGSDNVAIGASALALNTTADYNTAIGRSALEKNTTGSNNVAIGRSALIANTTGSSNLAFGRNALVKSTTGGGNYAFGTNVLDALTSGSHNISFGSSAGTAITSGQGNLFMGYTSGAYLISGNYNIFMGYNAGEGTSGVSDPSYNVAIGFASQQEMISPEYNTSVGTSALRYNLTGENNVALGGLALKDNWSATNTVAIGYGAAEGLIDYSNQNGVYIGHSSGNNIITGSDDNTFVGYTSGFNVSSGANNILIGSKVADNLTTGSNNIILGYDIDAQAVDSANTLSIGNLIFGTGINGTGTTVSSGNIGIGTSSPMSLLSVQAQGFATTTITKGTPSNPTCETWFSTPSGNPFRRYLDDSGVEHIEAGFCQ